MMTGFQEVKNEIRTRNQEKIEKSEAQTTDECATVASAMASMLCEAEGIEFAGTPVAPRHYNAVFGRTDEALWGETMDIEVMQCFDMGTWEIVDTADIPPECLVMGTAQRPKCDKQLPAGCGVMLVSHSVHAWRLCICSKSMRLIHGQSGSDAHGGYLTSAAIFGRHNVSRSHVQTNFWYTCKSTRYHSRRGSCRCR